MKNKKLAILALALSLIGTLGFAACGGDKGDATSSENASGSQESSSSVSGSNEEVQGDVFANEAAWVQALQATAAETNAVMAMDVTMESREGEYFMKETGIGTTQLADGKMYQLGAGTYSYNYPDEYDGTIMTGEEEFATETYLGIVDGVAVQWTRPMGAEEWDCYPIYDMMFDGTVGAAISSFDIPFAYFTDMYSQFQNVEGTYIFASSEEEADARVEMKFVDGLLYSLVWEVQEVIEIDVPGGGTVAVGTDYSYITLVLTYGNASVGELPDAETDGDNGGEDGGEDVTREGLHFVLNDDEQSYSVTYIGECLDTEIVIPAEYKGLPVTIIAESAFADSLNLMKVEIPDSVVEIHQSAFEDCACLTEIIVPDSVKYMDGQVFSGCDSLTIYCEAISESDEWNWRWASGPVVWDCNNNNVATDGCVYTVIDGVRYALKDGVATVVRQADNITKANILETLTYEDVTYSVQEIIYEAFDDCKSLTEVTLPNGITRIEGEAFSNCMFLGEIVIPESVTYIGNDAFRTCNALTIYCEVEQQCDGWESRWNNDYLPVVWNCKNNDVAVNGFIYLVVDGARYRIKDGVATLCQQLQDVAVVNIPQEITYKDGTYPVTSISGFAFLGENLTEVFIPKSIVSIGEKSFYGSYCQALTCIAVDEENEHYQSIDGNLYSKDGKTLIQYAVGKADVFFKIPEEVTAIAAAAFEYCYKLREIIIPESVQTIGLAAFSQCYNLWIYCESASELSGWEWSWNYSGCPVYYYRGAQPTDGYYWHYGENGEIVVWEYTTEK